MAELKRYEFKGRTPRDITLHEYLDPAFVIMVNRISGAGEIITEAHSIELKRFTDRTEAEQFFDDLVTLMN